MRDAEILRLVIPAKAGIQCLFHERHWVPAFAGTTNFGDVAAHSVIFSQCKTLPH